MVVGGGGGGCTTLAQELWEQVLVAMGSTNAQAQPQHRAIIARSDQVHVHPETESGQRGVGMRPADCGNGRVFYVHLCKSFHVRVALLLCFVFHC